MRDVLFRNRFVLPAVTLLLGMCLGGMFPHTPLHAVGDSTAPSCSGSPRDWSMKASRRSYLLDCLTGDLRAAVLGKTSGGFTATYAYPGAQLMKDFNLDPSKNPKFLMVTGLADLRSGRQSTFCAAVVYVVELSSGMILRLRHPLGSHPICRPHTDEQHPAARRIFVLPETRPRPGRPRSRRRQGGQ